MTVVQFIEKLSKMPPEAIVHIWENDEPVPADVSLDDEGKMVLLHSAD